MFSDKVLYKSKQNGAYALHADYLRLQTRSQNT